MSPPDQRRAMVGGVPIYYQVAGAGPPLVLLHGLSGSGRWWVRNVGPLAERFRVHVVDLIGFGHSRGPRRFALREASDYLVRWLDQLGVDRAHLVGHSMGGFIAADLAADHPDRVDHLVLVDAAALPTERGYRGGIVRLLRTFPTLPLGFVPLLLADAARSGPVTLWRAAGEVLAADLRPKLASIQAPTLLIWGARDPLVPLAVGQQVADALHCPLVTIERAGHNPMWDRPIAFNQAVLEFLQGPTTGQARADLDAAAERDAPPGGQAA